MKTSLKIALRYLFSSRGSTLLITFIAFLGVFMSVSAILLTMGVFAGFQEALKEKILSGSPHVVVSSITDTDTSEAVGEVKKLKGVKFVIDFKLYNAILSKEGVVSSVSVKAVDFKNPDFKLFIGRFVDEVEGKGVLVGEGIADLLDIQPGDSVVLVSPLGTRTAVGFIPKTKQVRVAGVFSTGMYDKDYVLVYMNLGEAESFFKDIGSFSGVEVYLENPYEAQEFKDRIEESLGGGFIVRSWIELNRPLFNALELEKLGLFFVLLLMVFVASFNITSLLFMKVKEKIKDIAVMKTYGVSASQITFIFLFVGMTIGFFGATVGVIFSYAAGYVITEYKLISVPEDIYLMSYVPVYIRTSDVLFTILGTFFLSFVSSLTPSLKAARENVINILRNE